MLGCVLALLATASTAGRAQATASPPLEVRVLSGEWIGAADPLVLRLSRALADGERLVVTAGARDLTPQLETAGLELRFRNRGVGLAAGPHTVTVTLVLQDTLARELLRHPVRVEGVLGIRERRVTRSVEAGLKSRLETEVAPTRPPLDRDAYNDADGQLALGLALTGRDFSFTLRSAMVGTTHRPNALRYGLRRDRAPLFDLSSFLAQLRRGPVELSLGHVAAGNQRHLLNSFSSRGAALRVTRARVDASLAALHGTSLVGWDDALGFTQPDHRILSGTLGVELLPAAGALRLEASTMSGSALPRNGFNQGAVTDAETSDGAALRLQGAWWDRRLRLDAGVARSTFDNPPDPFLGPVDSVVRTARETRDARYVESSLDLLRARKLFGTRTASLTLGAAHERVDPLYRSIGSWIQSDRAQQRYSARASVAGVTLGAQHGSGENNVDRIPSILTTQGRQTSADLSAPLGTLLGRPRAWLPSLSARLMRNHQLGVRVPTGGGFDPSHVPDQVSDDRSLALTWQHARGMLTLQGGRSEQDNRQPGRERADLRNTTRGAQVSLSLHRHATLGSDLHWTRAQTLERDVTEWIRRVGLQASLFATLPVSLALQAARTTAETPVLDRTRDDLQWSAQLALRLPARGGVGGRAFLRYQAQEVGARDPNAPARPVLRTYFLDSGITLSLP